MTVEEQLTAYARQVEALGLENVTVWCHVYTGPGCDPWHTWHVMGRTSSHQEISENGYTWSQALTAVRCKIDEKALRDEIEEMARSEARSQAKYNARMSRLREIGGVLPSAALIAAASDDAFEAILSLQRGKT